MKPPKKGAPFVRYVNFYQADRHGAHSISTKIYKRRARAIKNAQLGRIATLKITTTVEVV